MKCIPHFFRSDFFLEQKIIKDPWHVVYLLMTFVAHQMIMPSMFAWYNLIVLIAQQIKKGSMCVVYDISSRIKKIIMFPLSSKRFWFHNEMHFSYFFRSDFFVEQQIIKDPWHVVYLSITFNAPEMVMGSMFAWYDLIVLIAQQIIKGSMCDVYCISTRIRENNYDSIIFLKVLISQWNAFLSLFPFRFFRWAANN